MYYIGIDIGTTSVCGVLYDSDTSLTESVTIKNDSIISSKEIYERLQDPERIFKIVEDILIRFMSDDKKIGAIGITGQMHGMLYTYANGNALSPLVTWQDSRGNRKFNDSETYAEFLSRESGHNVSSGYGLVTHYFNQHCESVPPGSAHICTIMDYIAMRLTDNTTPLTDPSNAASLGFFNKSTLCFDEKALNHLGVDCALLPRVALSNDPVGFYNDIPVYPAIGDNQSAFIGSVANKEDAVHVTVGTSSQISVYSPEYIEIPSIDSRTLPGGGYILVGAELCGGYSLALLKNFFGEVVRHTTGTVLSDEALFAAMAEMPTGGEAPLKIQTQFNGTRQNPEKRGSITNISSTNFLPGNLYEGFMRGISEALYDYYSLLPDSVRLGKKVIVASGNGLRKNHRLREIFEETFHLPVILSESREEAAYGAAIFACQCLNSVL